METPHLEWYRRHVCEREFHRHDDGDGLLRCLVERLARLQNGAEMRSGGSF